MRLRKPFVSVLRKSVRVHTNEQFSVDNQTKENGTEKKMYDENRMSTNKNFQLERSDIFQTHYKTNVAIK